MKETKKIGDKETTFSTVRTNSEGKEVGYKYHLVNSISIARYIMYNKLQPEIAFDVGFAGLWTAINDAYTKLNEGKTADAAVILFNTKQGMAKLDSKKIPIFQMCGLFILREDEDVENYDSNLEDEKIQDWSDSGIDMGFFFTFATKQIARYQEIYNTIFPNDLNPLEKVVKENEPIKL